MRALQRVIGTYRSMISFWRKSRKGQGEKEESGFGKLQGALSPIPINFANKTEILTFFSDIMISVS